MAFSPLQKKRLSRSGGAVDVDGEEHEHEQEKTLTGTPVRYLPLDHVYSATDPGYNPSGSSNVMSKKVKARKLADSYADSGESSMKRSVPTLSAPIETSELLKQMLEDPARIASFGDPTRSRAAEIAESARMRWIGASSADSTQPKRRDSAFGDLSLKRHSEVLDRWESRRESTQMKHANPNPINPINPMNASVVKKEPFDSLSFPSYARVYTRRGKKPNFLLPPGAKVIKIEADDSSNRVEVCSGGAGKSEKKVELGKIEKVSSKTTEIDDSSNCVKVCNVNNCVKVCNENKVELDKIEKISKKKKVEIDDSSNHVEVCNVEVGKAKTENKIEIVEIEKISKKVEIDDSSNPLGVCNDEDGRTKTESKIETVEIEKISRNKRKRSAGFYELASLGIDPGASSSIVTRTRERRTTANLGSSGTRKRNSSLLNGSSPSSEQTKKWVELSYDDVEPTTFVGLQCKVYWPLDDDWYTGRVGSYNSETGKYHVKYDDGEEENVLFSKEKIKFYISSHEMQQLSLKQKIASKDTTSLNDDELLVLATIFDDCGEIQLGDIVWAKIPGHAMWPAVVVSESDVGVRKVLKANNGETTIPVQFFGTHDFAWITLKQAISFLSGLHLSYHLKCKQTRFRKSLEEAKLYLTEQVLPSKMVCRQNGIEVDDCEIGSREDNASSSDDDLEGDKRRKKIKTCPFEIDDLHVISLGKIVTDSEHFHDEHFVWPEGYTAERKFISAADPNLKSCYKMEVLRDPEATFKPLFRVTMDCGEEFNGPNPSACWNKIYRRIRKFGSTTCNGFSAGKELEKIRKSGSHMFGFSNPKVSNIIKELSNSRKSSIYSRSKLAPQKYQDLPIGYRPVRVDWKDLDKCNVCHMDEEYVDNVFLQCDKCRMMVHARCYGVLEPVDGVLWLCNLCGPEAPEFPPPCSLCPVTGGAMKPTTDGRWAHLACAIWIPETCLVDVKKMEPIDGLRRVNKDRWKLLCSICGVTYGACIQCSNPTCRVAFHPLCARAAGLCVELEDEDKLHLMSFEEEEDEDNQCIRFFSFCKKHRQPSNELLPSNQQAQAVIPHCSAYVAPPNPSGCARTEPYDFLGRRGRKEPEAVAAASSKQSYVENKPYLVTGYCQNGVTQNSDTPCEIMPSSLPPSFPKTMLSQIDTSRTVLSTAEKYKYMKQTFRMRLAFGKSRIHKFGVFAKLPHKAGDMVIEYIGELVRPSIADRREHFIYNSLVGAGTYMFRIDDNRVIDATKAGSIAHLINHSCEPNCYSRAVNIHGEEHVIIFAKRDISKWEELTYDYRFFSIGEQLACYCGSSRCRGVVNDIDSENQMGKLWVPRSELIDWREDNV